MAGKRDAEANGDGKPCNGAGAADKRGQIVWERVFRAGNAGTRDQIKEARGHGGDFGEAVVGGRGRTEENGVEVVRGQEATVVGGFFGSEVGGEDAIGARGRGCDGESLETHLEDGIVVGEEDQRNLRALANADDEIDYAG